jgi:flagellar biosynthesis protein FlhA
MYAEADQTGKSRLYCITMDPALEDLVNGYIDRGPGGTTMSIPPAMANRIAMATSRAADALTRGGHQLIVLSSPTVRAQIKQILEGHMPSAVVLAYNEIVKGLDVESLGLIQLGKSDLALVEAGAAA